MKKILPVLFFAAACASTTSNVKRLSPEFKNAAPPAQCRLAAVLKNSPAERAGLKVGDRLLKVNGKAPTDAAAAIELLGKAPADTTLDIQAADDASRVVRVTLNAEAPRLGAVCDLTGWSKTGISAAGNQALTLFQGPYSVTLSGIIDDVKGLALLRARIVNHTNDSVHVGPDIFQIKDAGGKDVQVLTPPQAMCLLYGEKGARMLSRQGHPRQALDKDTAPAQEPAVEGAVCEGIPDAGRLSKARMDYVEANVKAVAEDSLGSALLAPGGTADGLIYVMPPAALPMRISATLPGHVFTLSLGEPRAAAETIPMTNLAAFFETQKRGTPLSVTLKKGRVFVGKFTSYDPIEEVAWFDAKGDSLLNSVSFPLRTIRSVQKIDR